MKGMLITMTILGLVQVLSGDGVIIPVEPEPTPMPVRPPWPKKTYLELRDHYVKINIHNSIARVEVEETFYNPYDFQMEGVYIFPIPQKTFPSKFSLIVNGKELSGEVLERDEARKIYEDIVRRLRDPALLEYYEHNLFRARVFPILPRKEIKTTVRYEYELQRKGDYYELFYPFKIEGLIAKPIQEVTISFKIVCDLPIKQVFSPTHEIDIDRKEGAAEGGYEATNLSPNQDFILYYAVAREDFDLSLLSYKKRKEDGFFLLGISGPSEPPEDLVLPKDIVFVIDCSGSMSGEKIEQAKKGLRFFVENLNPSDQFNIISFSSSIKPFRKELMKATRANITAAKDFIKDLRARGGTDINGALLEGLKILRSNRPSYLLFLTDGLPTVGVTNLEKIVENVETKVKKTRIFVFGVGYDVNTILLDRVAEVGSGLPEYIEPKEDLELAISSLSSKIMAPALEGVEVNFLGIEVYDLHPEELGDLFYGQDITIAGRYRGSGQGWINLTAKRMDRKVSLRREFVLPGHDEDLDFIPLIWAKKRVGFLLSEIRLHGENQELVDEIVAVAKKYGIVTPYTSYLVRDEERLLVPMALPAERFKTEATGRGGVQIAKDIIEMKKAETVRGPQIRSIRQSGSKTFYLKDGIYVDGEYREGMKEKKIRFLSPGYFALLKKFPEYARYFGLSPEIVVVIKGVAYRVLL